MRDAETCAMIGFFKVGVQRDDSQGQLIDSIKCCAIELWVRRLEVKQVPITLIKS
jgi:hypothetical protein